MKLRLKRPFKYQVDARTEKTIVPGIYSVPGDLTPELAEKIRKFGKAEIVPEKKAPENKVVKVPESKEAVGKVSGRRARPKSKKS